MKVKVAVAGCCHGKLHTLYEAIRKDAEATGRQAEMLLCCGDFQAIRSSEDLDALACPRVYRHMGDFVDYYSGKVDVPLLTIFIGGNHEASNALRELHYGGWVTRKIFYLGRAGIVLIHKGPRYVLRLGGLSGIYKQHDYIKGYFEVPPFDDASRKSIYHTRRFDVDLLRQVTRQPVDVMLSHDWPQGVTRFGDTKSLLRRKPYFRAEVEEHRLGNPVTFGLLQTLRPRYWFAAHLHTRFEACVPTSTDAAPTTFLALDKPLPGRHFIEFLDIEFRDVGPVSDTVVSPMAEHLNVTTAHPSDARADEKATLAACDDVNAPLTLCYDPEWLTILRVNYEWTPFGKKHDASQNMPRQPTDQDYDAMCQSIGIQQHVGTTESKGSSSRQGVPWPSWGEHSADLAQQRRAFLDVLGIHDDLLLRPFDAVASKSQPPAGDCHPKDFKHDVFFVSHTKHVSKRLEVSPSCDHANRKEDEEEEEIDINYAV